MLNKIPNRNTTKIDEKIWDVCKQRFDLIFPLSQKQVIGHTEADYAAEKLGISRRHVYTLSQKIRDGEGLLTDILPKQHSGGKGKSRISLQAQEIIDGCIKKYYLKKQKISISMLYKYINEECHKLNIKTPVRNTISSRLKILSTAVIAQSRHGKDAAHAVKHTQIIDHKNKAILDQIQIDHTVVDLIIVDQVERKPIGRPYVTLAIDVYSRCILGAVITLEPPSSTSVGICLSQVICDKRPWLNSLGIEIEWPMGGKPIQIYVDNAVEFKSEALIRGCDLHGIKLDYRPPGRPHYGGIVERVIGTLMTKVHNLPGTTFSNVAQKGKYNSEKESALTLKDLEKWMILSIHEYHHSLHDTIKTTPYALWEDYATNNAKPKILTNESSFLIDFLPIIKRRLTRTGFLVDHINYFCNTLKPIITSQHKNNEKFLIRRDPRDISRIWVLDKIQDEYIEVPYNSISNPSISLWEHKQAVKKLRELGIAQVNESLIFKTVEDMHKVYDQAVKLTKKIRRQKERKNQQHKADSNKSRHIDPPSELKNNSSVKPFDQIEDWEY